MTYIAVNGYRFIEHFRNTSQDVLQGRKEIPMLIKRILYVHDGYNPCSIVIVIDQKVVARGH